MKKWLHLFLASMITAVGSAAEIVAWKVPLSSYADAGLTSEGIARCQEVPESSPFFKQGDELWDLKGLDQQESEFPTTPEWIVWNATSGRLIAKAGWDDIVRIHQLIRPEETSPTRCRMKVEVFEVAAAGGPLADEAVPSAEVTFFTRSSQKISGKWGSPEKSINYQAETTFATTVVDTSLELALKMPGQADLTFKTAVRLIGKPLWIARDTDGKAGIDIRISAAIELLDGTPIEERIQIQKDNRALILPIRNMDMKPTKVGERGWITSVQVSSEMLMDQLSLAPPKADADPFAVPAATTANPPPLPDAHAILPPDFLHPWLDHEVLDARSWFKEIAPWILEGDFIGYDPLQERLFHYSADPGAAGMLWTRSLKLDRDERTLVVTTFEGRGQTRLVGLEGLSATLERKIGNGPARRLVEIQPRGLGRNRGSELFLRGYRRFPTDNPSQLQSQARHRKGPGTFLSKGRGRKFLVAGDGGRRPGGQRMKWITPGSVPFSDSGSCRGWV